MTRKDTLISWLNDAYATEQNLVNVLESHIEHAQGHEDLKSRYESHLAQTRRHAELIEQCLERLGGDTSTAKSTMGKMTGWLSGMGSGPAEDRLVKDALADFSMEHFEIASYKSLIAGAEQAGEPQIAETCRQILKDEEDMAHFLEEQIPKLTQSEIARQAA